MFRNPLNSCPLLTILLTILHFIHAIYHLSLRFIADLEFVTLLSNPDYLEYLATSPEGYFEKPEFIRYLHYLGYMFKIGTNFPLPNPSVLAFLQLVQSPTFRKHLKYTKTMNEIREAQHFHWSSSRETTYRQVCVCRFAVFSAESYVFFIPTSILIRR